MSGKTERNAPCPCGSGKKYKNCCIGEASPEGASSNPEYKFEPGSYETQGKHVPSIACLELGGNDQWSYLFMILKLEETFNDPDEAAGIAVQDLQASMEYDQYSDSDADMAEYLKSIGYQNSPGYNAN